ncbi:RNA polymerase sigma factor [Actinoplanes sp. NPDC051494]|uniref:RNA polymerase sigma factor n=1 Tax=Actinoplanes sp. NPDC051494 TaxID=3363907 RepID=UPI0037B4975E
MAGWATRRDARSTPSADQPGPATPQPTDEALARRAGLGDRDAFAVIVTRYGPALYRFVSRVLDEPADAEDALQETFIDAWKGLSGFRGDAALQTWLFTLARRRCYAHLKRFPRSGSRPHVNLDDVTDRIPARDADPAGLQLGQDLVAALDTALRTLPPRQRSVWILRQIEDFTYADIATVMAISPDAVRGLLERARATLAITLKEWR